MEKVLLEFENVLYFHAHDDGGVDRSGFVYEWDFLELIIGGGRNAGSLTHVLRVKKIEYGEALHAHDPVHGLDT